MGSSRRRRTTERQRREHAADAPTRGEPRVLLTTDEAADYLRLSPRTMERYRVTGEGAAYVKLGRRVFYEERALDDWLDLGRRRSTSDPGPPPPRP